MRNLYFVILALLIGCAKPFLKDDNMLTITAFSTSFETKASETAFEAGDKIGIFLENNMPNLRYETADGSTWSGFGNLTQFKTGDNVIAYYPYSETATSQSAIEVSSGVDFMICPQTPLTIADNKASAALNFQHVLSKLVVSMEMPSEIAGIKTASLESITVKNVFRKGVIDITTKAITGLTDRGDVVLTSGEAIIIPQTISRIEFSFKMANGTTEKLAHTKDLTLTPGTKTTLQAISNADLYFTSFLDLKNGDAQTDLPLSFYVAPGRTWTLTSSAAWLTFSATTGVGAATVKTSVTQNTGTPRIALLTLKDDKGAFAYLSVMQNYSKFELSAYAPNETVPKIGKVYTVNINSNKPWSVTSKTNVIVSPEAGLGTTAVTITIHATTIYTTREIKAIFATTGATITRTWAGTQDKAPAGTVYVGGAWWTTGNLTGTTQGQTTGFTLVANPQDYGMFWKWGSLYMYNRISGDIPDDHWDKNLPAAYARWAATAPIKQSSEYDYGKGLSSSWGAPVGDPCKSLGNYRTPTQAQMQALYDSGHSAFSNYKSINGYFFGQKATSCTPSIIQDGCIFLPLTGYRSGTDGNLYRPDDGGWYRSSSVYDPYYSWYLYFDSLGDILPGANYEGWRSHGLAVRCVAE